MTREGKKHKSHIFSKITFCNVEAGTRHDFWETGLSPCASIQLLRERERERATVERSETHPFAPYARTVPRTTHDQFDKRQVSCEECLRTF